MIVVGAGTGGTVSGIGKKVKEVVPNCKVNTVNVDHVIIHEYMCANLKCIVNSVYAVI